jgi:hypothetical protein
MNVEISARGAMNRSKLPRISAAAGAQKLWAKQKGPAE